MNVTAETAARRVCVPRQNPTDTGLDAKELDEHHMAFLMMLVLVVLERLAGLRSGTKSPRAHGESQLQKTGPVEAEEHDDPLKTP